MRVLRKAVLILLTLSVGGFMLVDGARNLLTGTYFGPGLGPWSALVRAAGFDPQHFGAAFALLGLAWFAATAGLLTRRAWARPAATAVGVLTVWYIPVGTVLALAYLVVVWTTSSGPTRSGNH